jgi:hypothetical protein
MKPYRNPIIAHRGPSLVSVGKLEDEFSGDGLDAQETILISAVTLSGKCFFSDQSRILPFETDLCILTKIMT